MVDFVLDNLGSPAGEGFEARLELLVLVSHLDALEAFGLPQSGKGQAPLFRLVRIGFLKDLRVEHDHIRPLIVKSDDPLVDADHIGRQPHAAVLVGLQGFQQILWPPEGPPAPRARLFGRERLPLYRYLGSYAVSSRFLSAIAPMGEHPSFP